MSEYYEIAVNSADRRCSSYAKYLTHPQHKIKPDDEKSSQRIESFRHMVESSINLLLKDKSICFDNSFLYRFLYARKFDCSESMDLLLKYLHCKQTNAIWQNINIFDQKIKHALLDGNPGVLRERDRRGRKVITFTAANWNTKLYSLEDIYRALLLTLDTLLEETQNQALGFVVIVDWTNFSYLQSTHLTPTTLKSIIEGLQMYQQIINIAQGIKSEYIKIDDIPLNEPYRVLNFEWKVTQYGSKVIAYLENNKWFYLPQRIVKYLNKEDPYLARMNDKSWTIVYKGRQLPNGSAIFEFSFS